MLKQIISLFALSCTLPTFAQWTGVTTPAMYHHYAIETVSNDIIMAGGYGGSLVRSTDGGDTWQSVSTGSSDWINAIHFHNSNEGWLVAAPGNITENGSIMKSMDGGLTWTVVKSEHNYSSMCWASATTAYVGTWEGILSKTTDGGATWTDVATPSVENLPYLFFLDDQNGFVADNNNKFFRTHDGGTTWESFTHVGIHEFYFFDVDNGYCVDAYGRIGTTTDGGATFSYWTSPYVNYKLHDIEFFNDQIGYVVGGLDCTSGDCITKPVILRTNDGGATWTDDTDHPYLGQDIGFYAITIAPNGEPYVAGSDKIVLKNDALAAGVSNLEAPEFSVYPNPANSELYIETSDLFNGHEFSLTDIAGNVLQRQQVNGLVTVLQVKDLAPGMYYVKDLESGSAQSFMKQ